MVDIEGQRIATEHVEIERLAARLQSPTSAFTLRRDVRALVALVPGHFHREERSDGPFARAVALAPDDAWRFDEIRDKHARMLEVLEDLFALVERDDSYAAACEMARHLAAELGEHERLENEWLGRVLAHPPHS
jgi:hypothetical protein